MPNKSEEDMVGLLSDVPA